jgi:hypothetical protein
LSSLPPASESGGAPNPTPPADQPASRAKGTARRIGEAFGLAIVFVFSLEAACRIEDWVGYRTPIFALERSQADLLIRDAMGMHGRPGGRYQKWLLNSFGMRGPEVSRVKPARVIRLVTAGASETFGLYESPGREYPRQLEDSLNAHLKTDRGACGQWRAEVLNAAMPGMSLPTMDQDVRLRVRGLSPDFVVLYPTAAAYLEDAVPTPARPDSLSHSGARLPRSYAFHLRFADRIRTQIKLLLPTAIQDMIRRHEISVMLKEHPLGWRFDSVPSDRLTAYETDLRHAIGTVRSIGAIPVLVTHANRFVGFRELDSAALRQWEKFYPRASGRTIVAFDSAARLETIRVARDSQTVFVDLAPVLARSKGAAFADYSHFTDLGAALAGEAVSGAVLADTDALCRGSRIDN